MEPLAQSDPRRIGDYTILARLGAGASGIVYAARDNQGSDVALKVLRPELADNASVRERLRREAEILRKVSGPRTVAFLDIDVDCLTPFLAMELVHGKSLDEYLKENGPIQGAMLTSLFESLVEALSEIHSVGVVHRDLKPSNVIFGRDGIKVADFGISSVVDSAALTAAGVVLGTASWISPEQINGFEVSASTDIFNLGLLMAFAATGEHPFGEGRSEAIMYRTLHEEPTVNGLPEGLKKITLQCLQKDQNQRPTADTLRSLINGKKQDNLVASTSTLLEEPPERTRIVGPDEIPSTTPPIAVTGRTPFESSLDKGKGSQKGLILGGILATALAVLAVFFVVGGGSSPKSSFEDEFEKILVLIEKTERPLEAMKSQRAALEKRFFDSLSSENDNEFWAGVQKYGPLFGNDYKTLVDETYDKVFELNNVLRAAQIGQVENRDGLLKIRSKALEHYSIWLEEMYSYQDVIDTFVFDDANSKSWNENYTDILSDYYKPIGKTWDELCLLLGDLQPLDSSIDYSKRIAAECKE